MRHAITLAALVALASALAMRAAAAGSGTAPDAPVLSPKDVLTWPRARADRFGCFLEKAFGHRDRRFNCALKSYANRGDPCRNVRAWAEGPRFPANKVALVHPLVSDIQLLWEHGALQAVIVTFRKQLEPREVWEALGVPDPGLHRRPNVMSFDLQPQGSRSTSLLVQGFEHMGAGEADCGQ